MHKPPSIMFPLSSNKLQKHIQIDCTFLITLHYNIPTHYFFNYMCARNVRQECEECASGMRQPRDIKRSLGLHSKLLRDKRGLFGNVRRAGRVADHFS